jgi:hypothetical protein
MKAAIYTLYVFFALLVLVVGFAVLDYCGGASVGLTSSAFLVALRATVVGAANALAVVCGIAVAFPLGVIALSPLILVAIFLRGCFKVRR